ncbi:MAG: hypothetical protein ING44_15875 [Telmatospirillum sp.]|nr:hypothetical protein [Telmatospirillum sp.]
MDTTPIFSIITNGLLAISLTLLCTQFFLARSAIAKVRRISLNLERLNSCVDKLQNDVTALYEGTGEKYPFLDEIKTARNACLQVKAILDLEPYIELSAKISALGLLNNEISLEKIETSTIIKNSINSNEMTVKNFVNSFKNLKYILSEIALAAGELEPVEAKFFSIVENTKKSLFIELLALRLPEIISYIAASLFLIFVQSTLARPVHQAQSLIQLTEQTIELKRSVDALKSQVTTTQSSPSNGRLTSEEVQLKSLAIYYLEWAIWAAFWIIVVVFILRTLSAFLGAYIFIKRPEKRPNKEQLTEAKEE